MASIDEVHASASLDVMHVNMYIVYLNIYIYSAAHINSICRANVSKCIIYFFLIYICVYIYMYVFCRIYVHVHFPFYCKHFQTSQHFTQPILPLDSHPGRSQ